MKGQGGETSQEREQQVPRSWGVVEPALSKQRELWKCCDGVATGSRSVSRAQIQGTRMCGGTEAAERDFKVERRCLA